MKEKDNIEMHYLKKPHAIEKNDGKVSGLVIEDSKTGELSTIPTNGIFHLLG